MSTFSKENPLDVALVGGGINGACQAVALLKKGMRVTVYESIKSYREVGNGIALGPNALQALDLIDPQLRKTALSVGSQNEWESKRDIIFEFFHGTDSKEWKTFDFIASAHHKDGSTGCARSVLLIALAKLIPDGVIHFEKRVTSIQETPEGKVRLGFRDGGHAEHDCVIGSDGIKSFVREYILGKNEPVFSGSVCHRSMIPMEKATELIGEEHAKNTSIFIAKDSHFVTLPSGKGWMSLIGNKLVSSWDSDRWDRPITPDEMKAEYSGFGDELMALLCEVDNTSVWAVFHHPHSETFTKGLVTMIGDAAHASTPYQGSGSSIGMEDAFVLAELLARATNSDQVRRAMIAYDVVRRPRGEKLVNTSLQANEVVQFNDPEIGQDVEKMRADIKTRWNWIWEHDLLADVDTAVDIMDGSS